MRKRERENEKERGGEKEYLILQFKGSGIVSGVYFRDKEIGQ